MGKSEYWTKSFGVLRLLMLLSQNLSDVDCYDIIVIYLTLNLCSAIEYI